MLSKEKLISQEGNKGFFMKNFIFVILVFGFSVNTFAFDRTTNQVPAQWKCVQSYWSHKPPFYRKVDFFGPGVGVGSSTAEALGNLEVVLQILENQCQNSFSNTLWSCSRTDLKCYQINSSIN